MADVGLTNIDNLLDTLRLPMQRNYKKQHILMAELERLAPSRTFAGGSKGEIPIILNSLQGGGNPGESGTINVPQNWNTAKAEFTLENVVQPIGITLDAEEDSASSKDAAQVALLVMEARNSLAEIVNDQFNFPNALLGTITDAATSLTVTVDPAIENFDALYSGRVVDVLDRTTGADPGQGKRRKIASVNETTGVITFDTAQTASDGGSGSIVHTAAAGIYIPGVFTTLGNNALTSVWDIASTTGTFQGINRTTTAGWQAVDGRGGDTVARALSTTMLDTAFRKGRRNGGRPWGLAVAHPAVIDAFKQQFYAMMRVAPDTKTLSTGFQGIDYMGMTLVAEDRFKRKAMIMLPKEDIAVYHGPTHGAGPRFVDDTGDKWQRFNRALTKEAWLRDKLQLVAKRTNRVVFLTNLEEAA